MYAAFLYLSLNYFFVSLYLMQKQVFTYYSLAVGMIA